MTSMTVGLLTAVCAYVCCPLLTAATVNGGAAASAAVADLALTLDAVDRAVAFMGRHSRSANLDGGIGLRTVEGQFGGLLARQWTELPLWLVARLKSIQSLAGRVAKETADSAHRSTPSYFANAGRLVDDHSWDAFFPSRQLPLSSTATLLTEAAATKAALAAGDAADEDDGFDEKFSDDCIREFYGATGRPACSISNGCWDTMVRSEGRRDYFLTHQVFYLISGINANCLYNLTEMTKSRPAHSQAWQRRPSTHPIRALLDKFCARILVEATAQETQGFPAINRDLFMEQVGLCGLAGYVAEFGQARWRRSVLGWQRANGCFGAFPNEPVALENFNPQRYGNYRRRRKRSEALMAGDGCLSHRTSVALDALVAFFRQQIESLTKLRTKSNFDDGEDHLAGSDGEF